MARSAGSQLPLRPDLPEVLHQQPDRQAALHLELRVDARRAPSPAPARRCRSRGSRPASRRAAPPPPSAAWQSNRAPARSSRRRSRCGSAAAGARRQQRGRTSLRSMLERPCIAEEQGLVGGHRLDHLAHQRARFPAAAAPPPGRVSPAIPCACGDRRQPVLEQVVLVRPTTMPERCRTRAPRNSRSTGVIRRFLILASDSTVAAMRCSGSTAQQSPAVATAPGMPQTTLVASILRDHRAARGDQPPAAGQPVLRPCRSGSPPERARPQQRARLRSIGSTDGAAEILRRILRQPHPQPARPAPVLTSR